MRLIIDLQGAQSTGSRERGIGRYSLALAKEVARSAGNHEVWIALNGAFPETIDPLRAEFDNLLPQRRIVVWDAPTPVSVKDDANAWRRHAAEIMRESFLASLKPDIVHVSSLFEGLNDDAITSTGTLVDGHTSAITLYDLIPLIHKDPYLANPVVERWYSRKLASMRRAGLWLAISESSRREGIDWLDLPSNKVTNVSTAADARFCPIQMRDEEILDLRQRYGLTRPFIMYTGGIDRRKNIDGLISAYALLPPEVRHGHQLAIVCSASKNDRDALKAHAECHGLAEGELVMTGFVSDDDLLRLYNTCEAFCFPSWHEGFGLPVLEAMQCGAAAIGSNLSSVPEVIGRSDALFDPHDQSEMAARLHRVMTDDGFRKRLAEYGPQRARQFSWQESARRAWAAFEEHHDEGKSSPVSLVAQHSKRPRLAYVSPLPPQRSGIADYSAELLPELARHYDIDVVIDQQEVDDPWIKANCQIRDVAWFDQNAFSYDRTVYQFGNSTFHQHMFDLLKRHPGVVVLHDFFLSGIISHMDLLGGQTGLWARALYESHGYDAVHERYRLQDATPIVWRYPANLSVLENALGVIVHSKFSRQLARGFYGDRVADDLAVVPLLRRALPAEARKAAREALGFAENDIVVCSFGMTGSTKLNHRLLDAWLGSNLSNEPNCHLVFVGENHGGDYGAELQRIINDAPAGERIHISGFAAPELYQRYLSAADIGVQLRAHSRGETSAAVLDCMSQSLPTIVNAHGAMAELPEDAVLMLPDDFTNIQLIAAIETLRDDAEYRKALGERAKYYVKNELSPRRVADQYYATIEKFSKDSYQTLKRKAVAALTAIDPEHQNQEEWISLARSLNRNMPMRASASQLLLDISGLLRAKEGGVQRATRSILKALLEKPPHGYRVEPVYATPDGRGYRYARKFTLRLLECLPDVLEDEPIELQQGDVFFGLDWLDETVLGQAGIYAGMRDCGIAVHFLIEDLSSIGPSQIIPEGDTDTRDRVLSTLSELASSIVCTSRSDADSLAAWLSVNSAPRQRPLQIGWVHPGSGLERAVLARDIPDRVEEILASLAGRPSFLTVGRIKPGIGNAQTLAAFEQLWKAECDVNLVVVGELNRHSESLVERLRDHPESGKRLFILGDISDELLERVYVACSCFIAASENESFRILLIEAARNKVPILALDAPVFREMAGDHASYFSGAGPNELASAIENWLVLYSEARHPTSEGMPWLTVADSVERLMAILMSKGSDGASSPSESGRAHQHSGKVAAPALVHS